MPPCIYTAHLISHRGEDFSSPVASATLLQGGSQSHVAPPLPPPPPQVQAYLETSWIPQLKHLVQSSLMDVNKGWFNISEDSWEVYLDSKLRRLMELVRYAMQVGWWP